MNKIKPEIIKSLLPLSVIFYYVSIKYLQYTFIHKIGKILFNKNNLGTDDKPIKLFVHL